MCDSTLKTSLILGALSLVPGSTFGYLGLGLASASLTVYVAHHYSPSQRLVRLEGAIKATEEMLERARLNCTRDQVELIEEGRRLLQANLSASKIQTQILEGRGKEYFNNFRGIMQNIDKCGQEVKAIQTSTLLTIEVERRRKLSEGIKEYQEVFTAIVRSPTRHAHLPSRRLGATDLPQELYMV
ncbi:hypothetical protein B0H17DRAFT_1175727 [Mycena rosella]|uniref:Uncharacterized protein n=1 Tax=Mycena rosella TaxID=1033263 RepID=A0AAD7GS13_MYCRO|nr:hypothetical protein B0H17DRAFT_1175727 [Mycena rosella]